MPRPMISSASSRALHWLIGRSESVGISQARAMIWQICSGVIRAGRPDLGASANRSTTLPDLCPQRARHCRTASESRLRRRATSSVLRPSAANSTMRARQTICCPVVRARTKCSSSFRSASVNEISGAFGPGMSDTSHHKMLKSSSDSSARKSSPTIHTPHSTSGPVGRSPNSRAGAAAPSRN
jgi:hypothetical protein